MSLLLFRSGWVFIGFALVLISFDIVPLKLTNPEWQLKVISSILTNFTLLLLGSVLISFASRREELDQKSLRQAKLLRTFLAWASLGLLLLIPIQFSATTGIVRSNYSSGLVSMRRFGVMIENLRNTKDEQEFREQLSKFPNVPTLPDKFNEPYQQVRQTIVEILGSRRAASINEFAKVRDQSMQIALKESFRNSSSLILLSYGFMSVALSDSSQRNIITSLAMFISRIRVGNLWFAAPSRRKKPPINPALLDDSK